MNIQNKFSFRGADNTAKKMLTLPKLCIVFAALVATSPVNADYGIVQVHSVSTNVEVESNGNTYTHTVDPVSLIHATIHSELSSGTWGKVESWNAWPRLLSPTDWTDFKSEGIAVTYPNKSKVKWVDRDDPVTIDVTYYAVQECNAMANRLRNYQGYSDEEIFSVDRMATIWVHAGIEYEMSSFSHDGLLAPVYPDYEYPSIEIVCKGSPFDLPPPAADDIFTKQSAYLTSVTLEMLYDQEPTGCPAEVTALVTYISETQGSFKSRFRSVFGEVSKEINLNMGPADKQGDIYVKAYTKKFLVGVQPDPTRTKPATPGVDLYDVDGFSTYEDDDELPPSNPVHTFGGANGFVSVPTKPNVHQDSLWVEVTSAAQDSVERSDYAGYKITCDIDYDPNFDGPDVFAQEPRPLNADGPTAKSLSWQ